MVSKSRGNGEGSIYQRQSDGKWCASLTLEGGKRRVLYGKTRQEVARKLREAQQNRDQGLPVAPDRQSFGAFLDRWLADVVRPSLRPRTSESYADLIRLHIKPGLGRIPLAKLDAPTILAFLNDRRRAGNLRREGGLSASSVRYLHAVIHKSLEQAVRWNLIPRNPAALVDPPRVKRSEVAPLAPEQARALLAAIERSRLGPLVTVALGTGMRQGELLGLRWEDVDWTPA